MEDFIQLKKDNVIRIGIKNYKGEDTGETLEFDLEDIELPLRYQELLEQHKKNINYVEHQFVIIDKKEDVKGKKLLSRNQEEKIKVLNEFFKREMDVLDLFLGEGKTQMILNIMGRKPYLEMFDDIAEALKPILPIFERVYKDTDEKIRNKYKMVDDNVLKSDEE